MKEFNIFTRNTHTKMKSIIRLLPAQYLNFMDLIQLFLKEKNLGPQYVQ